MKKYSVLCFPQLDSGSFNIISVHVFANDPEDAKTRALQVLKEQGYKSPMLAPPLPGTSVVQEIE